MKYEFVKPVVSTVKIEFTREDVELLRSVLAEFEMSHPTDPIYRLLMDILNDWSEGP